MRMGNPIQVTKPLIPKKDDIFNYLHEIMDSGWVTNMGPQHNIFEREISKFLEVPDLKIFSNGTLALITALKALDLPEGSEVITTPFTFAATPHAISWNKLKPVFVDIEEESMTISPSSIERAITGKTSAILPVHVYGFPCDVTSIERIANTYGLKVIYDAAHAFSTKLDDRPIIEWGDMSILSFHATKLFNTIEGGAICCKNDNLMKKLYELRNFGIKELDNLEDIKEGIKTKDYIDDIGINGKMNEIQAAWGRATLKVFHTEIEARKRLYAFYFSQLKGIEGISIPKMPVNTSNSFQYFPILIKSSRFTRDEIYEELKRNNIFSRKYFYPLCSDFGCYRDLESSARENLPVAHKISQQILCLPFYGELIDSDIVKEIVNIMKRGLR